MNIVWVVGNGFDLSLGLQTDYKSFLTQVYATSDKEKEHREKLESVVGKPLGNLENNRWADLEMLLAGATNGYVPNDDVFHETFEGIQRLFIKHVNSEEKRLPDNIEQA